MLFLYIIIFFAFHSSFSMQQGIHVDYQELIEACPEGFGSVTIHDILEGPQNFVQKRLVAHLLDTHRISKSFESGDMDLAPIFDVHSQFVEAAHKHASNSNEHIASLSVLFANNLMESVKKLYTDEYLNPGFTEIHTVIKKKIQEIKSCDNVDHVIKNLFEINNTWSTLNEGSQIDFDLSSDTSEALDYVDDIANLVLKLSEEKELDAAIDENMAQKIQLLLASMNHNLEEKEEEQKKELKKPSKKRKLVRYKEKGTEYRNIPSRGKILLTNQVLFEKYLKHFQQALLTTTAATLLSSTAFLSFALYTLISFPTLTAKSIYSKFASPKQIEAVKNASSTTLFACMLAHLINRPNERESSYYNQINKYIIYGSYPILASTSFMFYMNCCLPSNEFWDRFVRDDLLLSAFTLIALSLRGSQLEKWIYNNGGRKLQSWMLCWQDSSDDEGLEL